ncbi:hypothetical protein IQ07DRAFT_517040 [Pyrenochaeta sp. DS3sAY3a]|nr:hypothetical protein IQ07DRAFT_517040 [Pyrenochaeta sp. DS3sAY3a]
MTSEPSPIQKGSCSCGAIQIEIRGPPAFAGLCHCLSCQKTTSSAFSTNWVVPKPNFTLVSGTPSSWDNVGGSGNPVTRKFCGTCSCAMWTEAASFPGIVVVKAGVMDGGVLGSVVPGTEAWTCRRPGWVGEVQGATQFCEGYKA